MKLPFPEPANIMLYRMFRKAIWPNYWLHAKYLDSIGHPLQHTGADLVIEGFGRSGNTFAVTALHVSQSKPVKIASHIHLPVAVGAAVKAGKPVCLLIREPLSAITSFCLHSGWSSQRFLDHYIAYHSITATHLDDVCVCPFEEMTSDFNNFIERLNAVMNMGLDPVTDPSALEGDAFKEIEAKLMQKHGEIDAMTVHHPTAERAKLGKAIRHEIETKHAGDLAKARELHQVFLAAAKSQITPAQLSTIAGK